MANGSGKVASTTPSFCGHAGSARAYST